MPNRINRASLPPNLYRPLPTIFSNLMDRTILCRASDRSRKKKSNFAGFLGANSQKNRPILRHFRGNVWGKLCWKSIGKKGRFCGYFLGKILSDIHRFCADQTSVFNVFLTEVIICSFNNKTLQKWTNGKAFNIMASAQFFATQCTPGSFRTLFAPFSDEVSR